MGSSTIGFATSSPIREVRPNTFAFEAEPMVKPTGFREYDARWWFGHNESDVPPELNLIGVQALGTGLSTYLQPVLLTR